MFSHLESRAPKTACRSPQGLGALSVALGVSAALLTLYVVHGGMKGNALRLPYEGTINAVFWAPEGWKFFTRDCREERTTMYVRRNGAWQDAARTPNANPANAFGLNRIGRAQGIELGLLTQDIPIESWQSCPDENPAACLERSPVARRMKNISPSPSLCGSVGLVSQKPVPWAWAKQGLHVAMPIATIRLEVQC
jgi:antimicrobial peptide system SdpA family protein